jgi:hypothetical protein
VDKLKIVNLTPHALNIYDSAGDLVETVEPSGLVARASVSRHLESKAGHIELYESFFSGAAELGEPESNSVYVVSSLYLQALRAEGKSTAGVYVPGEAVRNEAGQVVGCVGLSR